MDDIPVDLNVVPGKDDAVSRTITYIAVPYDDVVTSGTRADAVAIGRVVVIGSGKRLVHGDVLRVPDDIEPVDDDVGWTGRSLELDGIP